MNGKEVQEISLNIKTPGFTIRKKASQIREWNPSIQRDNCITRTLYHQSPGKEWLQHRQISCNTYSVVVANIIFQ
ncbi:MAG: hypothetical protein ACI9DG_001568 [Oleispira sp.]|jgi:hypothetical protein